MKSIPVIDLFAGPGGLGEGFSAVNKKNRKFNIVLSIEKDEYAWQTLKLRSFFRHFEGKKIPADYYKFLRNEITLEELYKKYPEAKNKADKTAMLATLGKTDEKFIDTKIRKALKGTRDWVLIGGPPCQAYSIASRVRNSTDNGLDEKDERVYLYREYYRILAVHNPAVFIMENVKGLLSSKLRDELLFEQILNDLGAPAQAYKNLRRTKIKNLKCPGYNLYSLVNKTKNAEKKEVNDYSASDFVIQSEKFGIPQKRHRVIILGIRKDFRIQNVPQLVESDPVPVQKVLAGLPALRSGLSQSEDNLVDWKNEILDLLKYSFLNKNDSLPSLHVKNIINKIKSSADNRGNNFLKFKSDIDYKRKWFLDSRIRGVCNHSTRSHLTKDLYRYLFASCFAAVNKKSPKLNDFPRVLLPKHKNVNDGKFIDRFRVILNHEPSNTITSHISKDGHQYIHPDPVQCRTLTVREAARIQTFPDNYFFCGPRTSQYAQVGNAVPPLLANQIAEIVMNIVIKNSFR